MVRPPTLVSGGLVMISTPIEFVIMLVVMGIVCWVADRLGWWQ